MAHSADDRDKARSFRINRRELLQAGGGLAAMGAAAGVIGGSAPANASNDRKISMRSGMIVAPQPEAVEIGAEILKAGGNAVDAAIACGFAQGVIDPVNCGIAGFGSIGVYDSSTGNLDYIDFHARAPRAARPDMWESLIEGEARDGYGFILKGNVNDIGYQSICVPGALRGYELAHSRFGRMPWAEVLVPAIDCARKGWVIRPTVAAIWATGASMGRVGFLERVQFAAASRKIYCREDGSPKGIGETVVNADLADTLNAIARDGADTFYKGDIAARIAADMKANDGLLSLHDLNHCQATTQKPLWGNYRNYRIGTNQPAGGGIMLLEMLNILENFDLSKLGHNTSEYVRVVCEAMKYATIDKDQHVGDPEYLKIPVERLTSKEYGKELAIKIKSGARANVPRFNSGIVSKNTTHTSVVDRDGNCVTMTHSLGMGSGVMTPGLGFAYNNGMAVFDPRPGRAGSIAPGKARFSAICPSIVFKDSAPYLVIGAPGGTQIPMGVLQAILNVLDFDMKMSDAVAAPRFSATSNAIDVSNRILRSVTASLEQKNYQVVRSPMSYFVAYVHGIRIVDGRPDGGADPGFDGMALEVPLGGTTEAKAL